jgi:putative peptide zinc metalloprotease protein
MTVKRPTFHEAWYRVAQLRPKLLRGVQTYRQHFRGQLWYVLEDSTNNKYSRLSSEAYRFIAMLDGSRTVEQAWRICNEQLGDNAPTQPEIIQLLGQLYCSNLLQAELSPDTQSLFNRYRKRISRQIRGHLTNLLFIRIPLLDPDVFLDRWVGILGRVFSLTGLIIWSVMLTLGLYFVISNFSRFIDRSTNILATNNLLLLYLSFFLIKICHEFGHAFACKKFGQLNGNGGQVHTMGVMFLVFMPLPYVDASSSWAFRKKWHRAFVGLAGVMVELMAASIAAIIWAVTSAGTLNAVAHNIIFIASLSTIIFNGNPLLRFDGYYVLSDLIEIPNLNQRAKFYLYYLVKRFCWAVKNAYSPANNRGERIWFVIYGIASTAFRIFISIRILLFLNRRLPEQLFLLVPLLAFAAIIGWFFVPLGRFIHYLATGAELSRVRARAVGSTLASLALIFISTGLFSVADHSRIEGIVEPVELAVVYAAGDGFVEDFLPSGIVISPTGPPLIKTVNPILQTEKKTLDAERRRLQAGFRQAQTREIAEAQMIAEQIEALDERIERIELELSLLNLHSTIIGTWVAPDIEIVRGVYLKRGQKIGFVASLNEVFVRAVAGQEISAMLIEQGWDQVEIRVKGRADLSLKGKIEKIFPAGQQMLPSAALGYAAGGATATAAKDPKGVKTAERFFEIQINPDPNSGVRLLSGQRSAKPLAVQWYRAIRRLFQRRFYI